MQLAADAAAVGFDQFFNDRESGQHMAQLVSIGG